jgi:aminodeoxychorismate lyase
VSSLPIESESLIFVNGEFLQEKRARVSPLDRGFLYGDAVFETIRVTNGHCFLWESHMQRLELGARYLKIVQQLTKLEIASGVKTLLSANKIRDGFVRIHLSRGIGPRGYSLRGVGSPTLVIAAYRGSAYSPARVKLMTSSVRIMADEPWTQFKTANRLPNILARREVDEAEMDEALMLNHRWTIAGASAANVFCVRGDSLWTPPLAGGGLAGTTRAFVMQTAKKMGMEVREEEMTLEDFHGAEAAFLTSAGLLVAAIESLDSKGKDVENGHVKTLRAHCEKAAEIE